MVTAIVIFTMKDSYPNREQLTFCLQIILDIVFLFSLSVRMSAEVQNMMTSSQRIYQYTLLPQEDLLVKPLDKKLEGWPTAGKIEF